MTISERSGSSIVQYLPEEAAEFEEKVGRVHRGEESEAEFQTYRLRRGVYGQRQADRQMIRIKIPLGVLTADQMDILGRVVEAYAPLRKGHFTTRENLQVHHVPLDRAADVLRLLGTVGLTTREACGNTVRNVVGCPLAGVCPDEVFDATPYGAAFVRYLIRRDLFQNLPRKFKVAFTGCVEDHAITGIHDMGHVGRIRYEHGTPVRGVKIVVGGGTSIEPKLAQELYPFVTVDDGAYLRLAEAVLRVFNRSDELRKNRMRARIKILVHRMGIDKFRELVEQELHEPWAQKPIDLAAYLPADPDYADAPGLPPSPAVPPNGSVGFRRWIQTNVTAQTQDGYYAATVTLPLGDVQVEQFSPLAEIARRHGSGTLRVTQNQKLVLRWIPGGSLHDVWAALEQIGLGEGGAHRLTDVTACPGTDSCKLGITSSMGLGRAIRGMLHSHPELFEDPLIDRLHIKISGCPNGCGQHHIADIGFHGAAVKGDGGRQVPAFEVFIGGRFEGGEMRYGVRLKTRVPTKAVPDVVHAFLTVYKEQRQPDESFPAFVDRVGREPFEQAAAPWSAVPAFDPEHPEFYRDWDQVILYRVERGEGECAV